MIRIIGKIPQRVTVACSGGVDSMSIVHFLLQGRRKVDLVYFNHDTIHSKEAEKFVKQYCGKNRLNLTVGRVKGNKGKRSMEEFWRDERYLFLESLGSPFIITCHHLDDVVETWLMSAFHGNPKLIPYNRGDKIYRPFLMTERSIILKYAEDKGVTWIEDPSNASTIHARNQTRHNIVPQVLKVNPGIRSTLRKKMLEKYKEI